MKKILAQIKQYKKDTILTPIYAMLEVVMEVLLPYIMAMIIDKGIEKNDMKAVWLYGGLMAGGNGQPVFGHHVGRTRCEGIYRFCLQPARGDIP